MVGGWEDRQDRVTQTELSWVLCWYCVLPNGCHQEYCQLCRVIHMGSEPSGHLEGISMDHPRVGPMHFQVLPSRLAFTEALTRRNSFLITQILRQACESHRRDICGFSLPSTH